MYYFTKKKRVIATHISLLLIKSQDFPVVYRLHCFIGQQSHQKFPSICFVKHISRDKTKSNNNFYSTSFFFIMTLALLKIPVHNTIKFNLYASSCYKYERYLQGSLLLYDFSAYSCLKKSSLNTH